MSNRAKDVINTLKMENRILFKENKQLTKKVETYKETEENELEVELILANLNEVQMELEKMKKRVKTLNVALVVSWLFFYICM